MGSEGSAGRGAWLTAPPTARLHAVGFLLTVGAYAVLGSVLTLTLGDPFGHRVELVQSLDQVLGGYPHRAPFTKYLNALLLELGPWAVLLAHWLMAAGCAAIGGLVAGRLTGSALGVVAFYALFGTDTLFHLEVLGYRDSTPFALALMGFVALALGPDRVRRSLGLGALTALGWLSRATGVIVLPWLVLFAAARSSGWARRAAAVGLGLLGFAILTAPWQRTLVRVHGQPSLSPAPGNGLFNAVKGNFELAGVLYPWEDLDYLETHRMYPSWVDQHARGVTVDTIVDYARSRPGDFALLQVWKLVAVVCPLYVPLGHGELVERGGSWELVDFRWATSNSTLLPLVLPGFLVYGLAIAFALRRGDDDPDRRLFRWMVGTLLVLFVGVHLVVWVETRFKVPLDPLIYVCAAVELERRVRGRLTTWTGLGGG